MIELKDVSRTYMMGITRVRALHDISLEIMPGEFVAVMGPSGSGKSTLLHMLGLLDRPDSGSYRLAGTEVTDLTNNQLAAVRNRMVGFVFQQFHLLPRVTSLENVELPLIYAGRRHLKDKARATIAEVGLADRASHCPNELSGGEQQRVAIARALVNDPAIILADEPTGNLDTKSGEEIISILADLNKQGKTLIIVTHEEEIARRARRIIRMRDGAVISDEKSAPSPITAPAADISVDDIVSARHSVLERAEFTDHIRQAAGGMTSHKLRSALSMLGILIGVAAVIAMMALGRGAKDSIEERLASLGSNLLMVRPGSRRHGGVSLESGMVSRLSLEDAEAVARLPQVKRVSPTVWGRAQLVYGNKNWNSRVQGTGIDYAEMRASVPNAGRFFTDAELKTRQKVAVIGTTVQAELFGDADPVGAMMKINRQNFRIIGVMPEKGGSSWRDHDNVVVIPATTAMYRLLGRDYINAMDVEMRSASIMEEAEKAIRTEMNRRHRLNPDNKDSLRIHNMSEIRETLESTTKTMSTLLGIIAAISLLVGGIGIMNIMLVSVTERTREIGLRKAIGARRADLMTQFLIESVLMTFMGGAAGILAGSGAASLIARFAGWPVRVSAFSVILAAGFSIAIGMVFGLWPAHQAAKLNPIEALRYE